MRRSTLLVLVGLVAGLLVGGGIAYAATTSKTVKVCVTSKNVVRSASSSGKCPAKTKSVSINKAGPTGKTGATGKTGPKGSKGDAGPGAVGVNQVIPKTTVATSVEIYDDPLLKIKATCTTTGVSIFYQGSQGDHFTGVERTIEDGVVGTDVTDNYSSSGSPSATNEVVLDATLAAYDSTDTRQVDLTVFRVNGNASCRVFGRITP